MGTLSEALKKLIEEATNSANTSLDERKKQLECPQKSYNNSPSDKSNCQTLQDEITTKTKELKELKSKSSNDSEQTKKEINALKFQIKKAEASKSDCAKTHSLSDVERQKGLEEVEQQKEIVKKLETFKNSLTSDNNSILNNLCTGLEAFLGFDSDSKGYDGTGIVYSDLDRLCDGVVGFLFNIITDVKNNENLNIYNTNSNGILESIKLAKYNRKHFDSSIREVSQGIKEWVRGVEDSNENVMRPLKYLKLRMDGHMSAGLESRPITEQLKNWQGFSALYLSSASNSENALGNVDEKLRNIITPQIMLIKEVVDNFWYSVNDTAVDESVKAVKDKFAKERNEVNEHITSSIARLKGLLTGEINKVGRSIDNLIRVKQTQFKTVDQSISEALQLSDRIIESGGKDYRELIETKFANLDKLMKHIDPNDEAAPIEGIKSKFRDNVETILTRVQEIGGTLREKMLTMESKIRVADETMTSALKNVTNIVNEVTGKEPPNNKEKIETAVLQLKQQTAEYYSKMKTKQLESIGNHTKYAIENLGSVVMKLVDDISEQVSGGSTTSIPNHTHGHMHNAQEYSKQLQHITQRLISAAKAVTNQRNVRRVPYGLTTSQSSGNPLSTSLANLEHIHGKIQQYNSNQHNILVPTFNAYATSIKAVMSDFVNALKSDIQNGMLGYDTLTIYSQPATLHKISDPLYQTLQSASQLAAQLRYGLQSHPHLQNIDNSCNDLSTLMRNVQDYNTGFATDRSALDTLEQNITQPFRQLVEAVKTQADDSMKNGLNQILTTFKNNEVDRSTKRADSLGKLHQDFCYFQSAELSTKAGKIHQSIQKVLDTITNDVDKLPAAVNAAHKMSLNLMKCFEEDADAVRHHINAIAEILKSAEQAFDNAISQLQTSFQGTRDAANLSLPALQGNLQRRTNKAFNDLEDGVRKMFHAHKISDFRRLQECVSTQIPIIQKLIDDDANAGLKGLMKKLDKRFETSTLKGLTHLTLQSLANRFNEFFRDYFTSLQSQSDLSDHSRLLTPLTQALSALLTTMHSQRHFDATVSSKLSNLQTQLTALTPAKFAEASPLLNVVKAGVQAFHGELAKQYVSRYSGVEVGEMVKQKQASETKTVTLSPANSADNTEITEYGRKCAKVFLTSLATLSNDFKHLSDSCKESRFNQIHTSYNKYNNKLGDLFSSCGYKVSMYRESHEGELRNKPNFTGTDIHAMIHKKIFDVSSIDHLKQWMTKKNNESDVASTNVSTMNLLQILQFLYECLEDYCSVSHLRHIERPKSPSSVYQMLVWLTGLPHNRVFPKVSVSDIAQLFEKPDAESGEGNIENPPILDKDPDTLEAYPQPIAASTLTSTIHKVCVAAEDVLTSILGHGHADGIYAVDFNTNPDGFSYPTAPGACFDMLCDVLNRLYQQLFFLYGQCSNEEPSVSWRDCWYGNLVGGSDWKCNAMQCPNQMGKQNHKQMCSRKCDQTAQCGIKSPLQSFLEDGLPGFLPHSFTKPGCKLECSYSNHRGIPCRTPMGFADISVTASHRQRGDYLKNVLEDFCGKDTSPLTQLCAQLNCLLQKPPQTLGDIFAFYYGYLEEWAPDFYGKFGETKPYTQAAFKQAVNAAYFGEQYDALDPRSLLSSSNHGSEHSKGNLCSISNCESGSQKPCGLYVKSMTQQISRYYSADHKANHLSWIVYIIETFCDLLKKLYDDCCKKCGPAGSKCHVKSCVENCRVKYTDSTGKPATPSATDHHSTYCKSIVSCRDTHPTLYRYGFTFGHPWGLNGSGNNEGAKRTCKDFCEALKKMLAEGSVLITLRGQIDQFLWDIRTPFSYLVLALWSLSLFYLICVMVGRLDVLHIRSHLRTPSSHKITAQSLLAAAQVGRLAKISYLQP